MNTKPKFELNLNETNSLGFTLVINGPASNTESAKPEFRFVLSERGNGRSWLYPMARDKEGDVVVQIPSEKFFSEEKAYTGHVEVILGSRYFVPAKVDIEFIKPLQVEAMVSADKCSSINEDREQNVSSKTVSVSAVTFKNKTLKTQSEPVVVEQSKPKKRSWNDLSEEEQRNLVSRLKEQKLKDLQKQRTLEERKKKEKTPEESFEEKLKNQLKEMITSSLSLDDE